MLLGVFIGLWLGDSLSAHPCAPETVVIVLARCFLLTFVAWRQSLRTSVCSRDSRYRSCETVVIVLVRCFLLTFVAWRQSLRTSMCSRDISTSLCKKKRGTRGGRPRNHCM